MNEIIENFFIIINVNSFFGSKNDCYHNNSNIIENIGYLQNYCFVTIEGSFVSNNAIISLYNNSNCSGKVNTIISTYNYCQNTDFFSNYVTYSIISISPYIYWSYKLLIKK